MKKVTMEMNEEQAALVRDAVEEWFRLRIGQGSSLAEGLAFLDYKHDPNNPTGFERAIQTRNTINTLMDAVMKIAFPPQGYPVCRTHEVDNASDIWRALREALHPSDFGSFYMGNMTPPKITITEGDSTWEN